MHLKTMILVICLLASFSASAKVFWTVEVKGPIVTSVRAGFFIVNGSPANPNPAGSIWDASCDSAIFVGKKEDGTATPEWLQSEMIRLANTAAVGGYKVRVAVHKVPGDNSCYTTQVYPYIN